MGGWDSSYKYAKKLLQDAKSYSDIKAKTSILKQAWNAASGLPYDYPGKTDLIRSIEMYAYSCGIDLDEVSAY